MRILKPRKYRTQRYRGECNTCRCLFEASSRNEIHRSYLCDFNGTSRDLGLFACCPLCGADVPVLPYTASRGGTQVA